jgi:succinate dehydrogenase hydrophobic anchor subunit
MILQRNAGENSWLWLAKVASGAFVIVVLFLHLVVNHLVVEGGLMSYTDVIRYLSIPGIALMEMSFLVVVVIHSLIGLRSILTDLNLSKQITSIMDPALVGIGAISIIYGIWLMQTILRQGAA